MDRAVVHTNQTPEDLARGRSEQCGRDRFGERADAAPLARQDVGDRGCAGGDPDTETVVAVDRALRDELGVVRIRIRMRDGGDRVDS
jgi:hypothetical protein